ncbi:hypothetical protein [Catenulispora yoronensis]
MAFYGIDGLGAPGPAHARDRGLDGRGDRGRHGSATDVRTSG